MTSRLATHSILVLVVLGAVAAVVALVVGSDRRADQAPGLALPTAAASAGPVDTPPLSEQIPAGTIDPAALPERAVPRALAVALWTPPQAESATAPVLALLAFDAETREWVRATVPPISWSVALAPDGRRIAQVFVQPGGVPQIQVVDLATGTVQVVPSPGQADECTPHELAWSPDSALLAVASGCWELGTRLYAVDSNTGSANLLDELGIHDESSEPVSWAPDGAHIAYSLIRYEEPDFIDSYSYVTRVVALDGSPAAEYPNTFVSRGHAWRDGTRLMLGNELGSQGGEPFVLEADLTDGTVEGLPTLSGLGFVDGLALVRRGEGSPPCASTLCLLDPGSGDVRPWLTFADEQFVQPELSLAAP